MKVEIEVLDDKGEVWLTVPATVSRVYSNMAFVDPYDSAYCLAEDCPEAGYFCCSIEMGYRLSAKSLEACRAFRKPRKT